MPDIIVKSAPSEIIVVAFPALMVSDMPLIAQATKGGSSIRYCRFNVWRRSTQQLEVAIQWNFLRGGPAIPLEVASTSMNLVVPCLITTSSTSKTVVDMVVW